ncbi:cytochrome P450 [Saccharomonospora saliphila]|uniref:cytochrome P450 n=1 Tax=Saccharomonospora saliphila TaxID=369829 RepID=UPI00036007E3|nr:cytochrome P450 [Saccharomonospora saliphila]
MTTSPSEQITALYGPRFTKDPTRVYEEIRRRHGPVAPVLLGGDVPAWLVLGYRELYQVTSDPERFARTSRHWHSWHRVSPDWSLRPYVEPQPSSILTDAEEHRRLSAPLHEALAAVDQVELRAQIAQIADRLIDDFVGRGTADLVASYTHRLPLLMLARLFGLPGHEVPGLVRDVALSADRGHDAVRAHQRIVRLMRALVRDKRHRPGADLPSRILAHPRALGDDEIATDLFLTLAAAQLTTADWMGNTLRLMLTDDRFAITLSGGRRSIGQALNEVLWYEPPTQNFIGRFATADAHLGGQRIRRGDMLVLGLAAANTDPHARGPRRCPAGGDDGAVGNEAYLSFSHGEHGCPYPAQEIATTLVHGGIEVLLDRLPDVHLAAGAPPLSWRQSVWMRGLTSLPVMFTPGPPGGA